MRKEKSILPENNTQLTSGITENPGENSSSADRTAKPHWMRYDEIKNNTPWKVEWLVAPSDQQLMANVASYLSSFKINVYEMRISKQSDGMQYFVKVFSAEDIQKLTKLNFYEVTNVPNQTNGDNNNGVTNVTNM